MDCKLVASQFGSSSVFTYNTARALDREEQKSGESGLRSGVVERCEAKYCVSREVLLTMGGKLVKIEVV